MAREILDLSGLAKVNLTGNNHDPRQQKAGQRDDPECLVRFVWSILDHCGFALLHLIATFAISTFWVLLCCWSSRNGDETTNALPPTSKRSNRTALVPPG